MAKLPNTPLERISLFDGFGDRISSVDVDTFRPLHVAPLTVPVKTLTEVINANLSYYGETFVIDAAENDQVWVIWRIRRSGSIIYKEYANNNGLYTKRWDLRTSYFPDAVFSNTTSMFFDGVNDLISFGDAHLYDVGSQWSMSFWVWVDNNSVKRCIYSKVTPDVNVYGLSFQITTAGKIFCQVRAPGSLFKHIGLITIPTQQWVHICATYNGGSNMNGFRFYINNVLGQIPGSGTLGASILQGQTAMLGARGSAGTFPFSGYMDEVSMWTRALTAVEVSEIYNAGAPGNLAQHSQYPSLASWYPFDGDSPGPTITDNDDAAHGTMINMNGAANFSSNVP